MLIELDGRLQFDDVRPWDEACNSWHHGIEITSVTSYLSGQCCFEKPAGLGRADSRGRLFPDQRQPSILASLSCFTAVSELTGE